MFPTCVEQARMQEFGQGGAAKFDPKGERSAQTLLEVRVFPLKLPENC